MSMSACKSFPLKVGVLVPGPGIPALSRVPMAIQKWHSVAMSSNILALKTAPDLAGVEITQMLSSSSRVHCNGNEKFRQLLIVGKRG
eukprot:CAMPEP_0197263928 /NCGR_PEP_ID=MMETSP1432-20130617/1473_1 /TAXON_ID=44447 /ORGANISM="Pseudo-nitzschia delicatissima, Strain UNC1205" /LENGTH=86 /DNA_ID=CAMNT_0042728497 /DNA_START=585 /DNA_END=845 /DNA_ORIENTATION=-